jgi:hypothetical protein
MKHSLTRAVRGRLPGHPLRLCAPDAKAGGAVRVLT